MTDEKNTMCTIPWDLNRLSSFDFMKFTQAKEIGGGKQDLFMSLEGQKTWFRLACPSGGLVLNALRVTDAMAMFEARVFADANDRNPLASSTATKKADKATGDAYIRAAQDAALGEALKSAGFCLQTSTLAHIARGAQSAPVENTVQPAEAPAEASKPAPAPVQADAPMHKTADKVPVQTNVPEQKDGQQAVKAVSQPQPKADTAPRPAPVAPQPHAAPAPENKDAAPVVDINTRQPVAAGNQPAGQPTAGATSAPESAPAPEAAPEQTEAATYTADMTVEEITARMTLEQAKAIKVPGGTCKGWTLEQVAKDRPPSLKWLRYTAPFADNELKAAAGIILNDLELKMAG